MDAKYRSGSTWLRLPLRFSLRTVLLATLVAAVFFAWFGWRLRKSQRQARAVAVLQALGAVYTYDFQTFVYEGKGPGGRTWRSVKPVEVSGNSAYPRRLRKLLGVDFLHNITRVHLETSYRLADDDIDRLWSALGDLPDLVYLEASGPVTRPGAIRHLHNHKRLQRLALRWAHIADSDLAVVAKMPRLELLNLNETPVSSDALIHASRAKSLRQLELHHTKISDAGLSHVAGLPQLKRLRLSGTDVGDEGVRHLRGLEGLIDLNFEHTNIGDQALEDVSRLTHLQRLDLSLTRVTELGISRLTRLVELKQLRLDATGAGPEALLTLPSLAALEELDIGGDIVSGDLSPLARCSNLRVLVFSPRSTRPLVSALAVPPTVEEIRGLALDSNTFDFFSSLPNLRIVHVSSSVTVGPERAIVQDFKTARPRVQVVDP